MSARPIASATVAFGLVSIPMKIYASGESSSGVHFNMLHKKCGTRLKQQYVCPKDEEIVPRTEMVKGYEFSKGRYVTFTEEELKALQERATQSIDITEFLATDKVDPIYFEQSYYLGPDKGGERAYRLLVEALRRSGRSALAKYAARGKQYLVLVRPLEQVLVMQQLRYADELRPAHEIPVGDAQIKPAEINLALQIVDQAVSEEFRPQAYEDDVRKRILAQIGQKVDGQEIQSEPEEQPRAQVIDLMAALKASLASRAGDRRPARHAPERAAAPRAATGRRSGSTRK